MRPAATGATSIRNPEVASHFVQQVRPTLDLRPELTNVRCPTLVLAGEQDPVIPIEDVIDLVEALPADLVQFERFDDCGHGSYRVQPERTEAILREFFTHA